MNPSQPIVGSAMPIAPPTTQLSCRMVSDFANAEARSDSGTSRWMIASSATLPSALVTAATPATSAAMGKLKKIAATRVTAAAIPAETSTSRSGRHRTTVRQP